MSEKKFSKYVESEKSEFWELVGLFPPIVKRFTTKIKRKRNRKHVVDDVAVVVVAVDDVVDVAMLLLLHKIGKR